MEELRKKTKDWEAEFDKKWDSYSDKTPWDKGFQHYNYPNKIDKEKVKDFIYSVIHQEQTKLLEKIEKEVIGELEEAWTSKNGNSIPMEEIPIRRNELRIEQCIRLEDLKKTLIEN